MNILSKFIEASTASSKRNHDNVANGNGSHHGNKAENPSTSKEVSGSPLRKVARVTPPRKAHVVRFIEPDAPFLEEDGGNAHQLLRGLYKKMTGNPFVIPRQEKVVEFVKTVVREQEDSTKGVARSIMEIANSDINFLLERSEKLDDHVNNIKAILKTVEEGYVIKEGDETEEEEQTKMQL